MGGLPVKAIKGLAKLIWSPPSRRAAWLTVLALVVAVAVVGAAGFLFRSARSGSKTDAAYSDYTVVSGDSLSAICDKVKPKDMTVPNCVDTVVTLNGLASANDMFVGQRLKVPGHYDAVRTGTPPTP